VDLASRHPPHRARVSPSLEPAHSLSLLDDAWQCILHAAMDATTLIERWQATASAEDIFGRAYCEVIRGHTLVRADQPGAVACLQRADAALSHSGLTDAARLLLNARTSTLAALLAVLGRDFDSALARLNAALVDAYRLPPLDRFYLRYLRGMAYLGYGRQDQSFVDLLAEFDFVAVKHPGVHAMLSLNLGAVLVHVGDWHGAESTLREALARAELVQTRGFATVCRLNLAYTLIQCDRAEEASDFMAEAVATDSAFVSNRHPGDLLGTAGESLVVTGYLDEARSYTATLRADAARANYRVGLASADWCDGLIARRAGDTAAALRFWHAALWKLRRSPHVPHRCKAMREIAAVYAEAGRWQHAYRWHRRFHAASVQWEKQFADARLRYVRERQELQRARDDAMRDPVTGLLNRRGLIEQLAAAIDHADVYRRPLQVCMIDLDNLKPINDRHGHATGDAAIAFVADELRATLGSGALIYRYGGDEFVAALPGVTPPAACALLQRVLGRLRSWRPPGIDERRQVLSASVGIADFPADGTTADGLLDAADTALYRAKKSGGDQLALLT
jgi:diguanylate cyclase (GGDEF)-like protein